MKREYFYLILLIIALIVMYLVSGCKNRYNDVEEDDADSTELVAVNENPTVSDVLELRRELIHSKYIDSVYLAMPEQIVVAILVTEGANKSPEQIVQTYITNKDFYDNIIKKSMDAQKQYLPDSVPKTLIPQPTLDSLSKKNI